jgi:hypothetical protein
VRQIRQPIGVAGYALPTLAVLALRTGSAHALNHDTVVLDALAGLSWNSNVLGVSSELAPAVRRAVLQGQPESGWVWEYGGGLHLDSLLSRQRVLLDATVSRFSYPQHDALDYTGYALQGRWNWGAGHDWFGTLLGQTARTRAANVGATLLAPPVLQDTSSVALDANYAVGARWTLNGAINADRLRHEDETAQTGDFDGTGQSVALVYATPRGDSTGLRLKAEQGHWPHQGEAPADQRAADFHQYSVSVVVDWGVSGRSQLSGDLGYTWHESTGGGSSGGTSGRLAFGYALTGKARLQAAVYQLFGPLDDASGNYVQTRGVDLSLRHAATAKTTAYAAATVKKLKYIGGSSVTTTGRDDSYAVAGVGLQYQASRRLSLSFDAQYEQRTSNVPLTDYHAYVVSVRAVAHF